MPTQVICIKVIFTKRTAVVCLYSSIREHPEPSIAVKLAKQVPQFKQPLHVANVGSVWPAYQPYIHLATTGAHYSLGQEPSYYTTGCIEGLNKSKFVAIELVAVGGHAATAPGNQQIRF